MLNTILKNSKLKDTRNNCMQLMQYVLKKGCKNKVENMLRDMLFYLNKKYIYKQKFQFNSISNAFLNTTPIVNVKTKRKGSKNIYIPVPLKSSHGKYLSAHWLITHAKLKSDKKFFKNFAEEIFESANNKSLSAKKCLEIHKLAENSLNNLKGKTK